MTAVVSYRFDIQFLLDLDAISLTRLMDMCRETRKNEILESAIAMRNAMNADEKQFKTFMENYSPEAEPETAQSETVNALRRMFGGGV